MSSESSTNKKSYVFSADEQHSASSCHILATRLDCTSYDDACDRIQSLAQSHQSSYIVAANVHVVMQAHWQPEYRHVLKQATLITPDGMPLVWGICLLCGKKQSRVYGPDLMIAWCDRASQSGLSVYLYGSTTDTLTKLSKNLQLRFPDLKIVGMHSPPFRPLTLAEEAEDAQRINDSGASVVLVGLGCPKQEKWMYRQLGQTKAVMIGVGAAFRFYSGEVRQAPRWMQRAGLEWLFRLCEEPGRLWKRYVSTNSAFVLLFSLQVMKKELKGIWARMERLRLSS